MTASGSLSALSPTIRAIACLALAGGVHQATPGPEALRAGLALFALIGGLWMTQALHLSVTALLVPLLAVVAGLMSLREALASFAHPIIFLFLGGFALAAALQQQGLDRALAHAVLRLAAGRRALAVALLFGLTALLSMWISNTATAAMVLPMALGLALSLLALAAGMLRTVEEALRTRHREGEGVIRLQAHPQVAQHHIHALFRQQG